MSPEERAVALDAELHPGGMRWAENSVKLITDAIRAAVLEERAACAHIVSVGMLGMTHERTKMILARINART